MSDVREVSEYHAAHAATFAGKLEALEAEAIRLGAPHLLAQADQLRAEINAARDGSLRALGVIPPLID